MENPAPAIDLIIYVNTPPKNTNMKPQTWWFVDGCLLFQRGIFRFQPLVFGGVYANLSLPMVLNPYKQLI